MIYGIDADDVVVVIARYTRGSLPCSDELCVPKRLIVNDKGITRLNIFRRMFDAEYFDELDIVNFDYKIKKEEG